MWSPFGGHDCKRYEPKQAEIGTVYKCCCGAEYTCIRTFPWKKWKYTKSSSGVIQ